MTRLRQKETSIISLAILFTTAFSWVSASGVATSRPLAAASTTLPLLIQAGDASAFPLPTTVPVGTKIRIGGSSSMETINQVLKQRFEQQFVGTEVELNTQGTGPAIKDLLDGTADLAAIGRALTDQEKAQGLVPVRVSRHKIAIIVGSENPFKGSLTFEQFAKIFRGELKDWSQIGGVLKPIRFIDRPDNSDTRQAFRNYPVFKRAPFTTGTTAKQLAQDSTSQVVQALGTDGIGYAIADQLQGRGDVRVIPMHKALPSNPRYPFSQPLIYVYKGPQPNPSAQAFLGYATTPASRQTIETARKDATAAILTPSEPGASSPKVTVPSPQMPSPSAQPAPQAALPAPNGADGFPVIGAKTASWWLWWLGLPLFGGVLWWLLKSREAQFETFESEEAVPTGMADFGLDREAIATGSVAIGDGLPPTLAVDPTLVHAATADPATVGEATLAGDASLTEHELTRPVLAGDRSNLPLSTDKSHIVLVPRSNTDAYVYWSVPDNVKTSLRQQVGQTLALRLYTVKDAADLNERSDFQQFDANELTHEQRLPLRAEACDADQCTYVAELGYVTANRWLRLARSAAVGLPSLKEAAALASGFSTSKTPLSRETAFQRGDAPVVSSFEATGTGGAVLEGAAMSVFSDEAAHEMEHDRTLNSQPTRQSQVFLVPRNAHNAYVYWDVSQADKDALKHQGGQQLVLRVYEVTDTDSIPAYSVQQFLCNEWDQDQHVPIPVSNLDYVAELGYTALDGRFLKLAQSVHTRVPGG